MNFPKLSILTSIALLTFISSSITPSIFSGQTIQVLAQTQEDQKAEADRLLQQGLEQYRTSQLQSAIQFFQQAFEINRDIGDPIGERQGLNNIGFVYNTLGQYSEVLEHYQQEHYQQALVIAQVDDRDRKTLVSWGIEQVSQATQPEIWQEFSPDGEFNVLMPGIPELDQPSQEGEAENENFWWLQLDDGLGVYGLGYLDFPDIPESLIPGEIDELFDSIRARIMEDKRLLSEQAITLEGHPGREIEFENPQSVYKARIYWVGHRLYLLMVARSPNTTFTEEDDRFLESFTLLENASTRSLGTSEQTQYVQDFNTEANTTVQVTEAEQLFQQGLQYRRDNQPEAATQSFEAAVELWQQALTFCQENVNQSCEALILNQLGEAYHYLEQDAQALESHQQALNLYRAIGDRAGEGDTLWRIGEFYRVRQEYSQAAEFYQQALTPLREVGDLATEGAVLSNLGTSYARLQQNQLALETHQQALKIARETGDRQIESVLLNHIASTHNRLGQYSEALESSQQSLKIIEEIGDWARARNTFHNMGVAYAGLGQYSQALESYQQALSIAQEIRDRVAEGAILTKIGEVYEELRQYSQSVNSLQQALLIARELDDPSAEYLVLNALGTVYTDSGRSQQALEVYQQTLAIAREVGDRNAERVALNHIAARQNYLGQYNPALESSQQALAIARELDDRAGEGAAFTNIGAVYGNLRQYPQALDYHQQALSIAQETGEQADEIITLANVGSAYSDLEQYAQSLNYYQQALSIAQELGYWKDEQLILNSIGDVYFQEGFGYWKSYQPEAATQSFEAAIQTWQQSLDICQANDDRRCEAYILNQFGEAYHYLGQDYQALNSYQQALTIFRGIGDRAGEGETLWSIGEYYRVRSEYSNAIEFYQQALPILREVGDFFGEHAVLNNLDTVYRDLGQNHLALESYQQLLSIMRELGHQGSEGRILNNIGNIYTVLEQHPQALNYHQQALSIFRELGDQIEEGQTLNDIGGVYYNLGQHSQALNYLQQALFVVQEASNQLSGRSILNNIGAIYFNLEQYPKALDYFQQALSILQEGGGNNQSDGGITLGNIGVTLFELGQLESAETTLLDALAAFDSQRQRDLTDTDRVSLFDTHIHVYTILQQVQISQNKIEAALETSERGRARAFVSLLSQRFSEAEAATNLLTPSISDIQQTAREQNATLVQYSVIYTAVGTPAIYIWVIAPTGEIAFRSVELNEENQQTLSGAIDTAFGGNPVFRGGSTTISNLVSNIRPTDRSVDRGIEFEYNPNLASNSLRQLHQLLIEPIADLLPTNPTDHIVFVPQGGLFLVPFAALQDINGDYLIEQHTISIAPSIQVLDLTRQQQQPDRSLDNALIVGNPSMPTIWDAQSSTDIPLSPLPGAEQEAEAIAQFLNTNAITGNAATETVITQQMPEAEIIHLATHGLLEYGNPADSGILDVPGAIALTRSNQDDGLLTSAEILEMQLQAKLVVLSACDTGRGRITGDGVVGLSRAFISAGVPSVVVSLWSVPDAPTSDLMTEFYRQLETQPDKAQALRQAMLITMQQHPDPIDWAAFTLIGEAE